MKKLLKQLGFKIHTPHIRVWNVCVMDKEADFTIENIYFLFHKPAWKFFMEKSKDRNYYTVLIEEPVYFW